MVLSVVLCLFASSLVAFFLYPRSVVVVDDGIHAVAVRFDHPNTRVIMNMTVAPLTPLQQNIIITVFIPTALFTLENDVAPGTTNH